MDVFITTVESVIVLLGIGVIGFWIIKKKVLPETTLSLLSPLALEIALPSLVFVRIYQDFSPVEIPDWWTMPLWWLFFMTFAAIFTYIFSYISQKETRNEFRVSLFYQNAIFFPLAILSGLFSDNSIYLVYLFLFTIFYPAFFFNTYHLFFKKKIMILNWRRVFNNVLLATLIGLIIIFSGFESYVPNIIVQIVSLLGAMTLPLIMLIIGGNIYIDYQKKGTLFLHEISKFVIVKNIVFPILFLGIILIIRPAYHIAFLLLLQAAVPPVTAVPLFTKRAGGNQDIVNQFVVASFITSLITLPVMITIFGYFFPI